jgi:hypothetical protein
VAIRVPFGERKPRYSCKFVIKSVLRASLISGVLRLDEMAVVFVFRPWIS